MDKSSANNKQARPFYLANCNVEPASNHISNTTTKHTTALQPNYTDASFSVAKAYNSQTQINRPMLNKAIGLSPFNSARFCAVPAKVNCYLDECEDVAWEMEQLEITEPGFGWRTWGKCFLLGVG